MFSISLLKQSYNNNSPYVVFKTELQVQRRNYNLKSI